MDKEAVERHLKLAEEHIATGEQSLSRQKQVIAELGRDGHDTTQAREILRVFQDIQAMHIEDRDRLRRELASLH